MSSHNPASDPDPGDDAVNGAEGVADSDPALAPSASLGRSLGRLQVPGPSPEASRRLEARFARIVDAGAPGPLARVLAWFGFGTAGPRLAPRFAAGALLILAVGGTTSAATGVTPLEAASRLGDFARNVVTNLDPTSGNDAAVAPNPTPTDTPAAEPTATPTKAKPTATPTTASQTAVAGSPTVAGTPVSGRTPQRGGPTSAPPPATSTPGSPLSPTSTPTATTTPEPVATSMPSATPSPTVTATPTPTSTGVAEPTGTPDLPTPTVVPTQETTTYAAGSAGSVTILREGEDLTVVSVDPAQGWTFDVKRESGEDIEVSFDSEGSEIHLRARVVNGEIVVSVDQSSSGSGQEGGGS